MRDNSRSTSAFIFLNLVCFALSFSILYGTEGCSGPGETKKSGGPYYYKHILQKMKTDFPVRPVDEISAGEAKTYTAYYVVHYDEKGRIVSCEKILHAKTDWSSRYYYSNDGYLEKEDLIDPDGKKTLIYYDRAGNIIKNGKR